MRMAISMSGEWPRRAGQVPRRLAAAAYAVGLVLVLPACASPDASVRSMTSEPWGASSKVGTDDVLLGTQLWCTEGDPRDVTAVDWDEAEGVEVVDFVTLNQPAKVGRVGLVTGDIDTTQEIPQRSRVISTPCGSPPEAGSDPVTYLVLQLRLTDPDKVGVARGLRVLTGEEKRAVEPLTVVLCPEAYSTCDETTAE